MYEFIFQGSDGVTHTILAATLPGAEAILLSTVNMKYAPFKLVKSQCLNPPDDSFKIPNNVE